MKQRTRQRSRSTAAGLRFIGVGTPVRNRWQYAEGPRAYDDYYKQCIDFVDKRRSPLTGRLPPSDLFLRETTMKPVFIDYEHRWGLHCENKLSQWPATLVPGAVYNQVPPGGWVALEGNSTELTAKLLAGTNPFRYEVSVPVMIAELMEAGSLLKLAANNFVSLAGSAYLNEVFGWAPLQADIRSLHKITSAVESRIRDFNALLEKGGIRRLKNLANGGSGKSPTTVTLMSSVLGTFTGRATESFRTKVWGTVRWVPDRLEPVEIQGLANFNEALRVALDLGPPDLSTIWEATPWSWLIDYFVNVGDVLQAIESNDLVIPTEICLMRSREVQVETEFLAGPPSSGAHIKISSGSSGKVKHSLKLREVRYDTGPADLLSFGFISKAQATNLLALLSSLARFRK